MTATEKSDLWEFASAFYSDDLVKERCLQLQESHGASVDLILWLCWLHAQRIGLEPIALKQGENIVGGVNQELLQQLRAARTQLVSSCSFTRVQEQLIRKHVLNAELAIERILLQRLQDISARLPKAEAPAPQLSLLDYLQALKVEEPEAIAAFMIEQVEEYFFEPSEAASA